MNLLISLVAGVVALAFIASACVASMGYHLAAVLSDRKLVASLADSDPIVRGIASLAAAEAARELEERHPDALDGSIFYKAASRALDDPAALAEARGVISAGIGALYDYLESGDPETLKVPVRVDAILAVLGSTGTLDAFESILRALPVCSADVGQSLSAVGRRRCLPSGIDPREAGRTFQTTMLSGLERRGFKGGGEMTIDLVRWDGSPERRMAEWKQVRDRWLEAKVLRPAVFAPPVVLLLLLALLKVRTFRSLGIYWGVPVLVTGLVLFGGAALVRHAVSSGASDVIRARFAAEIGPDEEQALAIATAFASGIGDPWMEGTRRDGAVGLAVGAALVVIGIASRRDSA